MALRSNSVLPRRFRSSPLTRLRCGSACPRLRATDVDNVPTRSTGGVFGQFQYLTPPLHVHRTRIEDAWIAVQQRAAHRLEGLLP
jgi:hypothetical protein